MVLDCFILAVWFDGMHFAQIVFELQVVLTRYGHGSKPMVPVWDRCTTHFSLF